MIETNYGVILNTFEKSQTRINSITTHENYIYFSGNDPRISVLAYNEKEEKFNYHGGFKGHSHNIQSLVRFNLKIKNEKCFLISAGVNSDLCFYELESEGLPEVNRKNFFHLPNPQKNLIFYSDESKIGFYFGNTVSLIQIEQEEIKVLFRLKTNDSLSFIDFSSK